jgi:hypothetical protein
VDDVDCSEDEFLADELCVHETSRETANNRKVWTIATKIGNKATMIPARLKVDTGAECNVLSWKTYKQLNKTKLQKTKVTLKSFSGHKIKPKGKCPLLVEHKKMYHTLEFEVVDCNKPILGLSASI